MTYINFKLFSKGLFQLAQISAGRIYYLMQQSPDLQQYLFVFMLYVPVNNFPDMLGKISCLPGLNQY